MTSKEPKRLGIRHAGGILDRIVEKKMQRLEETKARLPFHQLAEQVAASQIDRPSFRDAVRQSGRTNIIAEVKRQSPSRGIIRADFNYLEIAKEYEAAGAAAISVLTEIDFFGGSLKNLEDINKKVHLPLLRKDFILDAYQLYEAKVAGASAVLLITAILEDNRLNSLLEKANQLFLDVLVEVHTREEMRRASQAGASLIGVNNRDLTTFTVDLETSARIAPFAPKDAVLVSESGLTTGEDIRYLQDCGYHAFLIGEHFMRQTDIGGAVRDLLEGASGCRE